MANVQNLKPFQPGQVANPGGRPRTMLSQAIRAAVTPEVARQLAEVVIRNALRGEYPWMCLLYDRLEGKAVQRSIEVVAEQPRYELTRATDEQLEAILQAARAVSLPEPIEAVVTEVEPSV